MFGSLGLAFIAFVCVYCMRMLVNAAHKGRCSVLLWCVRYAVYICMVCHHVSHIYSNFCQILFRFLVDNGRLQVTIH